MIPSLYTEKDLQEIWERQRFRRENLLTEDASRVIVEFPGFRSGEGGPDFRGARVVIGGVRRIGDVEIHLVPSGWREHGHDRDGAYAAVILHVVLRRDPPSPRPRLAGPPSPRRSGSAGQALFAGPAAGIPILVLEPYLAAGAAAGPLEPEGDLDLLGEAWYREARARMGRALERAGPDEVLYREILVALGYKHNKAPMAEVARLCPLASLEGHAGSIEARLRRAAESLPPALWRLGHVRPANHPWRRLSGMARFLAAARGEGLARGLAARAGSREAMIAWLDPDGTGQIGAGRAQEIALNVFVPFLGEKAWSRAAGTAPPGPPGLLRRELGGEVTTVRRYFGALRLLKRRAFSLAQAGGAC